MGDTVVSVQKCPGKDSGRGHRETSTGCTYTDASTPHQSPSAPPAPCASEACAYRVI
ncbi:hypothetical protein M404DRAFT_1006633 [Pisolithus tinctorius Marx 270]|uniref:Uncharacterized protein n=1 Tax=Pisolithus tinctorius Marx 270 TaxID=870435 RepID=A0A0C3IHV7_PISTI|nr:hypothetical protein M404DRAFT_1006633 [Pisolithus tinctorius Marx 270]